MRGLANHSLASYSPYEVGRLGDQYSHEARCTFFNRCVFPIVWIPVLFCVWDGNGATSEDEANVRSRPRAMFCWPSGFCQLPNGSTDWVVALR